MPFPAQLSMTRSPQERSFERLLAGLAARLLVQPAEDLDRAITDALSQVTEMIGLDRTLLIRLSRRRAAPRITHAWASDAAARVAPESLVDRFPWLGERIRAGHVVEIPRLDDLPVDAAIDKSSFQALGTKANLTLPLWVAGRVEGALSFSCRRFEREWPDALVERARIMADVFAGALAHKDRQEDLDAAIKFERKTAHIMRALIEAPYERQDDVLEAGLGEVASAFDADRAALWQFVEKERLFRETHRWLAEGTPKPTGDSQMPRMPWISAQLGQGAIVSFSGHSDLPSDAATDLAALRALRIGAAVFVPLEHSGSVVGALSIAMVDECAAWSRGLVPRVRLLGEAFALFLARRESERRERKAQAHAAHATRVGTMGVFAASLVHELTQPLAASLSNAETATELLNARVPDLDDLRATVADIVADSRRGGGMIQKLRRFLRHGESERDEFDLGALLGEVASLIKLEATHKGISIALDAPQELPHIVGDRAQIQQVLINLLLNALDAVADQEPALRRVELRARSTESGIGIEVIDRGVGMDESTLGQVFQPFFTTKPGGLGLGLSISQTIISNHGGVLSARSRKGAGSTFRIDLPSRPAVIRLLPSAMPPPTAKEAVFVIDEDDAMRRALKRQLQQEGYRVEDFANAQAFVERAPLADVACIVSDIRMPGRAGLELQATLARSEVRWPIVFISAHADIPTTVHAIKAGAVAFLAKPFGKAELLAAVAEALARGREDHRDRRRDADIMARYATLTPREQEVFELVTAGLLNKLIADRLGIAESTVKIHRARVMEKMSARSVAELVRVAEHMESYGVSAPGPFRARLPDLERM